MPVTEAVVLNRDCDVTALPGGARARLASGTRAEVLQSFSEGGCKIRTPDGALYQMDARDRSALEPAVAPASQALSEEMVLDQLKSVFDPEIPVNIVDLGLIYSTRVVPLGNGGRRVEVRMSLTAPGCAMADVIKQQVESRLRRLSEVAEVAVEVVFDPPWTPARMSEAAKLQLGFDLDYGASSSSSPAFNILR
ncbi:MAG: iron-sulfur cluster assembly protein [Terracidiphilus sp.]